MKWSDITAFSPLSYIGINSKAFQTHSLNTLPKYTENKSYINKWTWIFLMQKSVKILGLPPQEINNIYIHFLFLINALEYEID